jgi:hypothetical protein
MDFDAFSQNEMVVKAVNRGVGNTFFRSWSIIAKAIAVSG